MSLFSWKTLLEIANQILINLSSGWFGVTLVAPGFFGVSSTQEYVVILFQNLPFGILGMVAAAYIAERIKES